MAGARDAALRALIAFRRDGAWPESALKDTLRGMDRREAALATRLCNGVLQNRMLLDHWLSGFVRGKLQPVVREGKRQRLERPGRCHQLVRKLHEGLYDVHDERR